MADEQLRREIARFDAQLPIEDAWTPPASWYTSAEVYALERRAVFRPSWQPVARLADLDAPGNYASGRLAGEPWVVVRGRDGALRAFHNTCRHKGREVVQGAGQAEALVCGYHAWRYALDGRLERAPRVAGIRGFAREELSLPALRCAEWGAWAWVSGDPNAPTLEAALGPLATQLEARGFERLRFVKRVEWTLACNWKVYVDNYLDGGYHVPHMHPTLDAQVDMATYRTETYERSSLQSVAPRGASDARLEFDAGARIGAGALYGWLHPNFMLNRYGPCLDTNHVLPLGPDRCKVVYEFFFEGAPDATFERASLEQAALTQREDIAICESVQVGLASSGYDRGRYAPRVELGEHHFHRLLAADLVRGM
jgi:choline monooxygenase